MFGFGLFLLLAVTSSLVAGLTVKKERGDECSEDSECDNDAFFTCERGMCDCMGFPIFDESGRITCACAEREYRRDDGICVSRKPHLASCNSSVECHQSGGVDCIDNICACPSSYKFEPERYASTPEDAQLYGHCVANLGQDCGPTLVCAPGFPCRGGICRCPDETTVQMDGKCIAGWGHACSVEEPCRSDFSCINGICKCKYGSVEYYSSKLEHCFRLTGLPCNNETDCVPNAECTSGKSSFTTCECKDGYIQTEDNFCDKDFGASCSSKSYSSVYGKANFQKTVAFTEQCDRKAGLKCVDGQCGCGDESKFYDASRRKCLSRIGYPCDLAADAECVKNSYCIDNFCKCGGRYKITTNLTCEEVFNYS